MTFSDIVNYIETLPPLSDVVVDIQNLYISGTENVDMDKLIRYIELDPLLLANILKYVNSAAYGVTKKVRTAKQAVTLLGSRLVYAIVMDYAISEKIVADMTPYNITSNQLKEISYLQSRLTMKWLLHVSKEYAQFLAPLAFLMEAGKLIIAQEVKNSDYVEPFKRAIQTSKSIVKYEHELLGTTSYFVTGMLFEHWHFDPLFIKILKNMDYKVDNLSSKLLFCKNALKVIRTAVNVRDTLSDASIAKASSLVKKIGLDEKLFEASAFELQKVAKIRV